MTYNTKSCPYCGKVYTFLDSTKYNYGSPFRTCGNCSKVFIDKSYHELACEPARRLKVKRVDSLSITSIIVGLLFALIGVVSAEYAPLFYLGGAFFIASGVYLLWKNIKDYPARCDSISRELELSKQRLSNPEYAKALLKLGHHVPREYLLPHAKDETPHSLDDSH